jgi:hypothetical protein
MTLATYQPHRVSVSFNGGSFQVRGLALDDVAVLMHDHLDQLDELLKMFAEDVDQRVAVAATAQYAIALVRKSPDLVARIIALASDEPDVEAQARRLPIPVQIDAVKKIIECTFIDAGGAKKFFEDLTTLLTAYRPSSQQQVLNT